MSKKGGFLKLFWPFLQNCSSDIPKFGTWVYPMGSIVIALVCPLVRLLVVSPSVFKYPGDYLLVFSKILHEVRPYKGTKVTEPDFGKKNLWGH